MSDADLARQRVVTLASALITTRGATSVTDARIALEDAHHLLHPKPQNAEYRRWQESRGEIALTDEEVAKKQANAAENTGKAARTLAGHTRG